MRRLALAVVMGSLVLSACSEDSQPPTAPASPSAVVVATATCDFSGITSTLIASIFPATGKLRSDATKKLDQIESQCSKSNKTGLAQAQGKALFFIDWMNKKFLGGSLVPGNSTPGHMVELSNFLLAGFGLPQLPAGFNFSGPTTGVGVFDPAATTPLLVQTQDNGAALLLPVGSFPEVTLALIQRQLDGTLATSPYPQFAPTINYDVIRPLCTTEPVLCHFLTPPHKAVVSMCLVDGVTYPFTIRIGHDVVDGTFEVLDEATAPTTLSCPLPPNAIVEGAAFTGGLQGFALSAWRTAKQSLGAAAEAVLLPQPLRAATVAVAGTGSKAGSAGSLSPFGIVDPGTGTADFQGPICGFSGDSCAANQTLFMLCSEGEGSIECAVQVVVRDFEGNLVTTPTPVTLTLDPIDCGSGLPTGTLNGTTTQTTSGGIAVFNNLKITADGVYSLTANSPATDTVEPPTSNPITIGNPFCGE